jgi:hypothetical protein
MRGSFCRVFRAIGVSTAALLCAASCGDADGVDFDSTDGGGSSGKQSSGGASGKGSGGSGVGGSSGSGGSATGGASGSSATGGSGNVGGTSGSGGASTGGAAGNGTGGNATGGAGGSAGSPGSGGSGGATGSGGSTSTGGAGGASGVGGGPDGGACPATQPGAGSECEPDGLSCTYGDPCCPTTANCSGGHWIVLTPACVAPMCPDELPEHGKECDRCRVPAECPYDRCNGDAFYTARCNAGGNWVVTSTPCRFACGDEGLECDRDELCVKTDQTLGPTFSCEKNPCGTQPVSCACADSLCLQPAVCSPNGTGGRDVACACLICV